MLILLFGLVWLIFLHVQGKRNFNNNATQLPREVKGADADRRGGDGQIRPTAVTR